MADGSDAPVNGARRKLPFFRRSTPDRPIARRRQSTILWHRLVRSLLYLLAWIFILLVVIGNVADKPVLRNTYFLYLDLSHIVPLSVPNAVLINSVARSIGLHDFYQVGLWNFCEGFNGSGITYCSKPKRLYSFNPVKIILSELLSGARIGLPADISEPLHLARIASHWMFGLFLTAAVLNFILIFLSPLAVSSRPPQTVKSWAEAHSASDSNNPPLGRPPHRRRTFILLRSVPFLILTFFTALVTIVASAVATVMFEIFAGVFTNADPSINIKAHVGTQMLALMWIGSGFSLIAFIVQFGSCCASCCGGHKARKQLKAQGINMHEKSPVGGHNGHAEDGPAEPHAVSTN
ncbi:Actin cortical patch SUR7/pH-response regulator PalI [Penicillium alfredii]|uniref:Actin cortical patch SUR7/pH-response regulator PalI n=1 Tax=Penicillium alfredii TaxID=1506179 RepID=A0A9W9ER90_9EURO|nr:Actin cortical patch SUR7/pH-response regulator PalI [Penicillium alfredii]KAJ5086410.1 Actin cortical patch SUR7/pH-response regulator PalI [Penicillium alfredii]